MSGAIRDTEIINQRKLDSVKKRNDSDIRSIQNAHQEYKADLKKSHESEIVDIQNEHHRSVAEEANKKEKVLSEMKGHLQKTSELTDKELRALKVNTEREKVETQRKLSIDRERINAQNELYLEEANNRFNAQAKKVNYEGKGRVEDIKSNLQAELSQTEEYHQNKIQNKTEEFTTKFKRDELTYQQLKDNQDNQFKKDRLSTNTRQIQQLDKLTTSHNSHLEKTDNEYRKGLKEQDLVFEKKYESQLKHHNGEFKVLEEKNKQLIDGLKTELTTEIEKASTRKNDPFFKFETLKPRLKQFEDRVEVQVDIPEHSKQDMQLTINGKTAILSFNRRYNDAAKDPNGTINKINKIESFTTRLETGHFLDAKSVKTSYENGVMNYVIKKA